MTTAPAAEVDHEIRLAVVMYGGVSLAIYINGIAQELLRLVRATAAHPDRPDQLRFPNAEGTEAVYRTLAQRLRSGQAPDETCGDGDPIRARFRVDILSGTSAGGINAIYLAKALAHGLGIDDLKRLWIREGDIGRLINDAESVADLDGVAAPRNPKSLLNGDRMYRKLLEAFDGMDGAADERDTAPGAPLVDDVDLFVTTTDVRGMPVPLRLLDTVVQERRYRHSFRFQFRSGESGDGCDHFTPDYNRFLAFAARCTSAFPFAFEPMRLADAPEVFAAPPAATHSWRTFFPHYVPVGTPDEEVRGRVETIAFGDGGYLDNKPFSYATAALAQRRSTLPVDRKLLYVEPSPGDVEPAYDADGRRRQGQPPNALENVSIALSLARDETIREDLERVLARNRLIERVERILAGLEEDVAAGRRELPRSRKEFADLSLARRIAAEGVAYGGYFRLKVAALTDELTGVVARIAGFDEDSDEFLALRYLVRVWRDKRFTYGEDAVPWQSKPGRWSMADFLIYHDLPYRIRRLDFLLTKADELRALDPETKESRARVRLLRERHDVQLPQSPHGRAEFGRAMLELRRELCEQQAMLVRARARLRLREGDTPVHAAFRDVKIDEAQLEELLRREDEAERLANAEKLVADNEREFDALGDALAAYVDHVTDATSRRCRELLGIPEHTPDATPPHDGSGAPTEGAPEQTPAEAARRALAHYWVAFEQYDMVSYPILYSTEVGSETDVVEVARISPRDATSLNNDRDGRRKLGGTALMHFGAFLDGGWRWNDIVWGRLDGAERLISILYRGGDKAERDRLIAEAHRAILEEEFTTHDNAALCRFLADAVAATDPRSDNERKLLELARPSPGAPVNALFAAMLTACIGDAEKLRRFFATDYAVHDKLDPEQTVRALSRGTQVLGKMLEGIGDEQRALERPATWVTRLGRVFWGLVEVAVPGSIASLLFRHWLALIYLFAALMIVGGIVLTADEVRNFGATVLGITALTHLLVALLDEYMRAGSRRARTVAAVLVVVTVALAVIGAVHVPDLLRTALDAGAARVRSAGVF